MAPSSGGSSSDDDLPISRLPSSSGPRTTKSSKTRVLPPALELVGGADGGGGAFIPVRSSGDPTRLVASHPVFLTPKTLIRRSYFRGWESLEVPIETIFILPTESETSWLAPPGYLRCTRCL